MKTFREGMTKYYRPMWSNEAYDKIVYHGTSLKPGTEFNLQPPTFDHPFFVANTYSMATAYTPGWHGSIFILELIDDPYKLSFNFQKRSHLDILGRKYPITARLIKNELFSGHEQTFYTWSETMAEYLADCARNEEPIPRYGRPLMTKEIERPSDENQLLLWRSLYELGMIEDRNGRYGYCKKIEDIFRGASWGDNDNGIEARRIIKGVIYEAIYKAGFKMVMDGDTTGEHSSSNGSEFAILDKSVVKTGLNKSIRNTEESVTKVLEKLYGATTKDFVEYEDYGEES